MKRKANPELDAARAQLLLTEKVLAWTMFEKPVTIEKVTEDGQAGRYTGRLYRPDGADGGIIVYTFELKGQAPHVEVHRLDDMFRQAMDGQTAYSNPYYRIAYRLHDYREGWLTAQKKASTPDSYGPPEPLFKEAR